MRRTKKVLCVLISVLMLWSSIVGMAAEPAQTNLEAEMNYATGNIEVVYTNPLAYPASITVILAKADVTEPTMEDYLRLGQETCMEQDAVTILLPVGKDIADGTYQVFAFASGHDAANGKAKTTVMLISGSSEAILAEVNQAGQTGIADLIYKKTGEALKLETVENPTVLDEYIYNIREKDFDGFDNPSEMKLAWDSARMLYEISTMKVADIPAYLAANNAVFGLDLENEDYLKESQEVARILQKQSKSGGKITSVTELREVFPEAVAVAMVNKSKVAEKDSYFKKYTDILGISPLMNRYAKVDQTKVARQFDGAAFYSAEEVYTKLEKVIGSLEGGTTSTGNGGGRPSGGGGFGNGSGGGWASTEVSGKEEPKPVETTLFTDVDQAHWAWESIEVLSAIGVIQGYEDGSFRPEAAVTREEFVKLIAVAFEIENPEVVCSFEDVKEDDWFYPYVAAVTERGIINGIGDGLFGTGALIQRQDAAVILDRLLLELEVLKEKEAVLDGFTDADLVADYAVQSVARLTEAGIINGIGGCFAPEQSVSRAQAAKLIYGCMKYRSEGGMAE